MRKALLFVLLTGLLAWPASAAAKLTRADKASINRTLDAVVRYGVKRENPPAARPYVTGDMRGGTRAQWKRGDISIYPYPAGGNFHGWTFQYRSGNTVGVNLLLFPVKRLRHKVGPIMFEVDLVKHGNRWLVENFNPAATYTPQGSRAGITGTHDLLPGAGGSGAATGGRAKLGKVWLLVPAGVLGGGLLLGLGIVVVKWLGWRRNPLRT